MTFKLILILLLTSCALGSKYETYTPLATLPTQFNTESTDRYLLTQYKGVLNEQARVIYCENNLYLMDEVVSGSINNVSVNGLQIVINCTIKKCNKVILAHNHPGQYWARPSNIDLDNADKFKEMMNQADIQAHYMIIGEHDANWIY